MPERNPDGTWAKGSSGGPGRKRGTRLLTGHLRDLLAQVELVGEGDPKTKAQMIIEILYDIARHGETDAVRLRAIEIIYDRVEGRVKIVESSADEGEIGVIRPFELVEEAK